MVMPLEYRGDISSREAGGAGASAPAATVGLDRAWARKLVGILGISKPLCLIILVLLDGEHSRLDAAPRFAYEPRSFTGQKPGNPCES